VSEAALEAVLDGDGRAGHRTPHRWGARCRAPHVTGAPGPAGAPRPASTLTAHAVRRPRTPWGDRAPR